MSFESDLSAAVKELAEMDTKVRYALGPGVNAGAEFALEQVAPRIPVRTGKLKASAGWEKGSAGTEEASARVYVSEFYARFMDSGHVIKNRRGGPVLGYVPGRKFFETVILAHRGQIGEEIQEEVSRQVGI